MIYKKKLDNTIVNKVLDSIKLNARGFITDTKCLVGKLLLTKHLLYIHTDEDNCINDKIEHSYDNLINNYDKKL